MEALAVVGLASNILQFIEYGYKVIVVAKELHESGQDATQSNETTAFLTREMRELSLRVMNDLPESDLTDDEKALSQLAQQCSQLSNKLLVLLDSLKVKGQRRKRDVVTAVFRNIRKRGEREQLRACLDNYRAQLNVQVTRMSRSDLVRKLEHTIDTVSVSQQEILYLKDHVQKLQQTSMIDSSHMVAFFRELQEVVEVQSRQLAILQSIRYPRMHDRFENVEVAHRKTFEWLLRGPEDSQGNRERDTEDANENQTSSYDQTNPLIREKYRQYREFVTWLQGGNAPHPGDVTSLGMSSNASSSEFLHKRSIFRITGKPGAGKSTLMKFICGNDATSEYLKAWSGQKHLICAKAFFWRLGNDEQKSLAGLANCLLHQILEAAPALIPIAFPSAWKSDCPNPVSFDPNGTQAFELLLRSDGVFEKHKMIFFIDGLDEFDGHPIKLIREIIGWTKRHPGDLKICVSSRQLNEFEVGFKDYPWLRIQEWTRDDIKTFVTDRFDEISDLYTSVDEHDLNTLAEVIVDKAEGVFIWVRVVLAAIEQGVLNGDEFQDLQEKVAAFPSELKDLYQHLFDSIPEYDRQKAFETLIFTHYQDTHRPQALLRYKFLGDISKNPDFAMELPIAPRQINGRCRGFLEISPAKRPCHRGDEDSNIRRIIEPCLKRIDIFDRLCQSFLAFAKYIDTDEFFGILEYPVEGYCHCPFLSQLNKIITTFVRGPGQLEQVVNQRLQKRLKSNQKITLENYIECRKTAILTSGYRVRFPLSQPQLISALAAQNLLFEYFDDDGPCDLRALYQIDPASTKQLSNSILCGVSTWMYDSRAFKMLEIFFRSGISPSVQGELDRSGRPKIRSSLWHWILRRLVFLDMTLERSAPEALQYRLYAKGAGYRLIELCLRHGAEENFTLVFGPCYELIGANQLIVRVHGGDINGQRTDLDTSQFQDICVDYHLDIVRYASKKGGILTLRDLFFYCFPDDYHHLCELLDKKHPDSLTIEPVPSSRSIIMPILFPEDNRYAKKDEPDFPNVYFKPSEIPKHYRQCLAHSEKCFEDFEAKLKDKEPRGDMNLV
ncbi:hypothetical protein F5Y13DRAFT_198678 [Hypoxylon sp. FL1857]|nr:hypothetical protein F5Y13DRAFT_198678 [Hypoxylon sp. FL1857]